MNQNTSSEAGKPTISPTNIKLIQTFTSNLASEQNNAGGSRQVTDAMWSQATPVRPTNPSLLAWVPEMAELLGIDIAADPQGTASIFTGAESLPGSVPYAMRYGGHQFGNWAGQLGDGRAIALGEILDQNNRRWTLQLKGAGPTPYSRQGDGYAVLRSSIREYLCSEAMHHLGISTTRSLTLCQTGAQVDRDVFYDGNIESETGAVLCRAAESFIRFGSFEIHAAHREDRLLKMLADYVIEHHYPHLWNANPTIDTYQQWFSEVVSRTAHLIADWQRVGFVHAVMNTDNMSILGQTIDYGPYGWLEEYDLRWTPNFVDRQGRRYSYGNQPQIGLWNLYRLANALLPLFDDQTEPLKEVLDTYDPVFDEQWNNIRAAKTGLGEYNAQTGDAQLIDDLWKILESSAPDYTVFFRTLANINISNTTESLVSQLCAAYYKAPDAEANQTLSDWVTRWQKRLQTQDHGTAQSLMKSVNPKYVLRNHIAIEAIDAAEQGDLSVLKEVYDVMRNPYDEQPAFERYAGLRPDWATHRPGCTMLTCSS